MYNHKHHRTWDENLPYIQHNYIRAQRSSMGKSPFEICYGVQPSTPIDLISSSTQSNETDFEGREVEKELKFRSQIYNIQKQALDILQRANAKAEARHDKHCIPHSFQIGDHVWLHIKKERFTSPCRKLKPL